jgi:hypothetical protein
MGMQIDKAKHWLGEYSRNSMNDTFIQAVEDVLTENAMLASKLEEYKSKEIVIVDIDTIICMIQDKYDGLKKEQRRIEHQFNKVLSPEKKKQLRTQLTELDMKREGHMEIIDMLQEIINKGKAYPSEVQK